MPSILYFSILIANIILFGIDKTGNMYAWYGATILVTLCYVLFVAKLNSVKYPRVYKNLTIPSYLVLLGLIIVNFQTVVNVVLGYAPIGEYLHSTAYDSVVGKVVFAGNIAVCTFAWSHHLYKPKPWLHTSIDKYNPHVLWPYLAFIAFVLFMLNINVSFFLSGEDYVDSGGYDRGVKSYAVYEMLFEVFNTISLASIVKKNVHKEKWTVFAFIKELPLLLIAANVIYIFLRAASGDRGPVIYTSLMFFFSYVYLSKIRIRPLYVVIIGFVAAFVVSIANVVRSEDHSLSLSERVASGLEDKQGKIVRESISPYTQELASSVNCNFIAIHDIENDMTDYNYGRYSITPLLSVIPGSTYITKNVLGFKLQGAGEYISTSFFGKYYPYGLGTTPLAVFYLDFGLIGVILGFILIGIIYKRMDYKLIMERKTDIVSLILFLKCASLSIYLPRSSISLVLSKGVYAVLIYIVVCHIAKMFMSKQITNK